MVCLRLKPGAARWKVRTYPLSYGGTHSHSHPITFTHRDLITLCPPDYSNSISLLSVYLSLSLIFYSFQSLPNKLSFLFSQTLFTLSLNHTKSSHPFPLTISMYVPDNYFGAFLKMGHPSLFFVYFRLFQQTLQFLRQIYVKNVH